MKQLTTICCLLLATALFSGCNKADQNSILGGDTPVCKYYTVTNGHSSLNLYPYGSIGLAPGETSEVFKITNDETVSFRYKWSDDMDNFNTILIDLSKEIPNSTKNFIITK